MFAAVESFTGTSVRSMVAAASISLWLVGSTLNPVAAISQGSHLEWRTEPATASAGAIITSELGDPNGAKVKVVMYNGSGEQERIAGIPIELRIVDSPSGCPHGVIETAETNANGVAVFEPIIHCDGLGYRLQAFAADTASQNSGHIAETRQSGPFDIRQGDVTSCSGTCTDTDSGDGTSVEVTATSTGYLLLDLNVGHLTCAGYRTTSQLVTFDVVKGQGRTTVVITLDKDEVNRSAKKYEVCLEKDSGVIQLPDCPKLLKADTPSCVVSRKREKDRDVRVTISVEPGDPRVAL